MDHHRWLRPPLRLKAFAVLLQLPRHILLAIHLVLYKSSPLFAQGRHFRVGVRSLTGHQARGLQGALKVQRPVKLLRRRRLFKRSQ